MTELGLELISIKLNVLYKEMYELTCNGDILNNRKKIIEKAIEYNMYLAKAYIFDVEPQIKETLELQHKMVLKLIEALKSEIYG